MCASWCRSWCAPRRRCGSRSSATRHRPRAARRGAVGERDRARDPPAGRPARPARRQRAHGARRDRRPRRFDLLHSVALTGPLRTRAAHVVVLADATWIVEPTHGRGQSATVRLWQAVVPAVARRADRVIAISRAGAEHVVTHLRVPPRARRRRAARPRPARGTEPTPEHELRAPARARLRPAGAQRRAPRRSTRTRSRSCRPGRGCSNSTPTRFSCSPARRRRTRTNCAPRRSASGSTLHRLSRLRRRQRPRRALPDRDRVRVPVAERGLRASRCWRRWPATCRSPVRTSRPCPRSPATPRCCSTRDRRTRSRRR